jgi:uncharacterized protein
MHEPGNDGGRFLMQRDGRSVAELVYTGAGDVVTLDHTEVAPSMRGTGAGKTLIEEAVQWARANHKRFVVRCPYAQSVFAKTPTYGDVVEAGRRG